MLRVEICGNVATGKTTLATLLDRVGCRVVYEHMENNPFLNDFYATLGEITFNYDFETECTCFLMHYSWVKAGLVEAHLEGDTNIVVSDFSFLQDLSYARANLGSGDMMAFESLYRHCSSKISAPDLLVFLTCSEDILLERIRKRGRLAELSIDETYLYRIGNALAEEILTFPNVLTIDTGEIDLFNAEVADVLDSLRDRILAS